MATLKSTREERTIVKQGVSVAATRVLLISVSFVSSVVVARALPVEDRGRFGLLMATAALAIQFGNFGLPVANTYLVARRRDITIGIVSNTARFTLVMAAALGCLGALLIPSLHALSSLRGAAGVAAWLVAVTGLAQMLSQSLLVGQFRFSINNGMDIVARVGTIAAMAALWGFGAMNAVSFGVAAAVFSLLSALWGLSAGKLPLAVTRWNEGLARTQFRVGVRAYVACLASFIIGRLPIYVVASRSGMVDLAYYTQALVIIDTMLVLPSALGTVLFPRLAASSDAAARIRATRNLAAGVFVLMVAGAALVAWLSPWLLPHIYGKAYAASVPYLLVMLPGSVAVGLGSVMQNALSANGYPWASVAAPLLGVVVVAIVLYLTKSAIGCSWAYSIGGSSMMACSSVAWWLHRHHVHKDGNLAAFP